MAESQRQLVHRATQQFQEVSRKVAQAVRGTTEDVRTLLVLPNAARGGLEDVQQSVMGLVQGVVQTNLRAKLELVRLANPSPLVELQPRFVREYLDNVLQGSATLVRAIRRTPIRRWVRSSSRSSNDVGNRVGAGSLIRTRRSSFITQPSTRLELASRLVRRTAAKREPK